MPTCPRTKACEHHFKCFQFVVLATAALTCTVWYAVVHLAIGASTSASSFLDCNACVSSSGLTSDNFTEESAMHQSVAHCST